MSDQLTIRNINAVFNRELLFPTLTRYNRLESRPRTDNFHRAMRAEVRDALWMLCKQWQKIGRASCRERVLRLV